VTAAAITCDILVVGGSVGGTAAALAASEAGASVCLIEETNWLGGQLTVQGVCTPDENRYIETFGRTRRYAAFRNAIRDYYRNEFTLSAAGKAQEYFNPGSCWVSALSFEPSVAARILAGLLLPFQQAGNLRVFHNTRAESCSFSAEDPDMLASVTAHSDSGARLVFTPRFVLDATDTGDLLPMCGSENVDWVIGAESH